MCAMGKENFLARTPPFMGDILWEHLEILQKGNALYSFYYSLDVHQNGARLRMNVFFVCFLGGFVKDFPPPKCRMIPSRN